jgi:hypothetical protein
MLNELHVRHGIVRLDNSARNFCAIELDHQVIMATSVAEVECLQGTQSSVTGAPRPLYAPPRIA